MNVWSNDKVEELRGSILCTDWNVFFQNTHVHQAAEVVTGIIIYIFFCRHIIPERLWKYMQTKALYHQRSRGRRKEPIGWETPLGWSWPRRIPIGSKECHNPSTGSGQSKLCQIPTQRSCGSQSAQWQTCTLRRSPCRLMMKKRGEMS